MSDKQHLVIGAASIAGAAFLFLGAVFFVARFSGVSLPPKIFPPSSAGEGGVEKFASEADFREYLRSGQEVSGASLSLGLQNGLQKSVGLDESAAPSMGIGGAPERVSETTAQVKGIDEPDIVKTDGKEIYLSTLPSVYLPTQGLPFGEMMAPSFPRSETKLIKAFPPANLAKDGAIEAYGDLLLNDDTLVILGSNKIEGYDVSDPKKPVKKWEKDFENGEMLETARLYQGGLYVVLKTYVNSDTPCPIRAFSRSVECTQIYHPKVSVPVDTTYTALRLNPQTGDAEKTVSFVGSGGSTVVYMSENNLYLTYSYQKDVTGFLYNFFTEEASDLVPAETLTRFKKLESLDISDQAKLLEFQTIYEKFVSNLGSDEKLRLENEFSNRAEKYFAKHQRDIEKTGIVKIGMAGLSIEGSGEVSGTPLNQFSMDEYEGNLRIAATTSNSWGSAESFSDVFVLDKNLKVLGSVTDLGKTERIYSVRFIEDKGYVVTFRQTDPFYVLDLSDPKNPSLAGELKIPGFSAYLQPITKDKILGIGMEGSRVKISLFDVSSPRSPKEADKYILSEFSSETLQTHHAFLLDKKFAVFFLPGDKGGYVFSYQNDKLSLTKAVAGGQVRRAIYINNYLYIIGEGKITVLNENDWLEVNQLSF